jgi:hypothetical protein
VTAHKHKIFESPLSANADVQQLYRNKILSLTKLQDSFFQRPDAGEPRGSGMEPVILPDERRDTLAVTVCLPGRPGESRRAQG